MTDAGERDEIINGGKWSIINSTDALTFKQMRNVRLYIDTGVVKRQRTDSVLEKHFDLRDFAVEAEIWLTEPELVTWVGYTTQSNNLPPKKLFLITGTDEQGNGATMSSDFYLTKLHFIAPEEGFSWYEIRLESEGGVAGSA